MQPDEPPLFEDLLVGVAAITRFIWGPDANPRKGYRAIDPNRMPVFKIGSRLHARKSRLMRWIAEQEDRSAR